MITLLATAPALPLGRAGKFVAAAYIVVFVIVLVYVAIMAVRARRVERDLAQLRREVDAARAGSGSPVAPDALAGAPDVSAGAPTEPAGAPTEAAERGAAAPTDDPERSGSRL